MDIGRQALDDAKRLLKTRKKNRQDMRRMMTGSTNGAEDFRDSEQFRAECEARFWLSQYHKREALEGRAAARSWWNETIQRIAKIRGQKGADYLRDMMNRKDWNAASSKKRPESR